MMSMDKREANPDQAKVVGFIKITLVALLLFALNDANPYGYYQLLRWACFGVFAYLAYDLNAKGCAGWAWLFAVFALLYNPFLPMALGRDIWEVVNVLTAAVLAISMVLACAKNQRR